MNMLVAGRSMGLLLGFRFDCTELPCWLKPSLKSSSWTCCHCARGEITVGFWTVWAVASVLSIGGAKLLLVSSDGCSVRKSLSLT